LRKQKQIEGGKKEDENEKTTNDNEESSTSTTTSPTSSDSTITTTKASYIPPSSAWGDRFWTSPLLPSFLTLTRPSPAAIAYQPLNKFPTPYFTAGMIGYIVGMLSTLTAMQISSHPQPALIYLVPGVLGALWGTALVRGEVKEMWVFSDAAEEEEEGKKEKGKAEKSEKSAKVEESKGGEEAEKAGRELEEAKEAQEKSTAKETEKADANPPATKTKTKTKTKTTKTKTETTSNEKTKSRTLFTFSIIAPPPYWTATSSDDIEEERKTIHDVKEAPTPKVEEGEHAEKRRRIG